jgi:hypothetical protein
MFGLVSSAGVFGAIADMLVALYKAAGFSRILKWVDDFFVIHLPNEDWTEQDLMALTATFGIPWSAKKMRPLSTVQHYIGFDWNLKAHTVKLTKILQAMDCWLQPNWTVSTRDAASMHSKLVHVSCIFPLIWPFLHGLAHFPLSFRSPHGKLQVHPPLCANLSWIQSTLQSLPNEIPLAPAAPVNLQWWGNASTSFGIGIIIGSYWAVWKWAPSFKVGLWQDFDIRCAKAIAIKLGL